MQIYRSQLIKASLIIIIIITGLIYLKTSSFGFVNWDDDENIRTNVRYKELNYDNLKYHFQHSRFKALAIWSFMADARLFGGKATGFHLHNVLLHIVNILLVFFLIRKITKKDTIALITAGLFALHPVFIEPVAWVTGRKDLLFVLFSLLAIICYLQYLEKKHKLLWLLAVILLVYLASLAKIQATTIPLLLFAVDWFYKRKFSFELILEKFIFFPLIFDKWAMVILLFLVFFLLYLFRLPRLYILKKNMENKLFSSLFWYLLIISFIVLVSIIKFSYVSNFIIFLIVFLLVYIITCFFTLKNRSKIEAKLINIKVSKKIALIIIPLIIIPIIFSLDHIIHNYEFYKSYLTNAVNSYSIGLWSVKPDSEYYFTFWERLIFAPNSLLYYVSRFFLLNPQDPMVPYPQRAIGGGLPANMITTGIIVYVVFAVIVGLLFWYIKNNRLVLLGFLWFVASISVVMHVVPIEGRVLVADRYAYPAYIGFFMIAGVATDALLQRFRWYYISAGMTVIILILGVKTYMDLGTWKSSKTLWERALTVNPQNHYAMYSLSLACFAEERSPEKALKYLDQAIGLKEDFQYFNNRGRIRYAVRNLQGAIEDFDKSIKIDSNSFAAYNNRGAVNQQLGNYKTALTDYNKAIALNSRYDEAVNNRRKVLHLMFLDSLLNNNLSIPPEIKGDVAEFIERTSQTCINKQDLEKAGFYLSKGISLYPDNVSFHEKLAVMYQLNHEPGKALEAYNRGLFYLPLHPTLLFGRGILFLETGDTVKACDDFRVSAAKGNPDAGNLSRQFCR